MLTLLKKPSPEVSDPAALAWHPDFRNDRRLPDTKVIRTSFLINGIAILFAAVALIWVSFRAYQLREVSAHVADWQQQIDRDSAPSAQAIALYKKFQAEAAVASQVKTFIKSRPIVSDLLIHLGGTIPAYMAMDRFELNATTLNLRGTVRGSPDQASGRASAYVQTLKTDKYFSQMFSDIRLVNLSPNTQTGSMIVDVSLKLREGTK
jgi:hypothetical protein